MKQMFIEFTAADVCNLFFLLCKRNAGTELEVNSLSIEQVLWEIFQDFRDRIQERQNTTF